MFSLLTLLRISPAWLAYSIECSTYCTDSFPQVIEEPLFALVRKYTTTFEKLTLMNDNSTMYTNATLENTYSNHYNSNTIEGLIIFGDEHVR